ncbi:MHZ4 [Scenedesmus sp. PABB004]|nr:MHZ4 [Scenedesmus sp. PABB004]
MAAAVSMRAHAAGPRAASAQQQHGRALLPALPRPGAARQLPGRLLGPPAPALAPRRRVAAAARAAAAAPAAAAAAHAAFPALQAALEPWLPYAMAAAAACCAGLILLMVVAPGAPLTQRSARSNAPLLGLAVLYGLVLTASWATDTLHLMMPGSLEEGLKAGFRPQFFPTLESVQALFGRPFTAASFLLHVAAINLIAARAAYLDACCSAPWSARSAG